MYVKKSNLFLFGLIVLIGVSGFFLNQNASAQVSIDPASIYYNDSGNYVPYKLLQNSNNDTIITKDGSFVFNKNTCAISFYDSKGNTLIGSDSYSVLASQGNSGVWNPVSIINNAACSTNINENHGTVTITGSKSVTGAGVFTINYTKAPLQPLKLTFSATNQNPSWTNYHIGLEEYIQVPQTISLGNQAYDLSQYNNTVLNRAWISSHNSQLLSLTNNLRFNMGLGWNNVGQITVNYIGGKAYLKIDYTFNTPILSPGNTITVDPSIDTDSSVTSSASTTAATQTISITVGSHNNRMLIVSSDFRWEIAANGGISSVKIGSTSFTNAVRISKTTAGTNEESSIWYLVNPPTGAQTITITPNATSTYRVITESRSLYNVNQTSPIGVTAKNSGSGTAVSVSITPTTIGSWIQDSVIGQQALSSPSNTSIFNTQVGGGWSGASQYNPAPTIGGSNTLSWTMGSGGWATSAIEIKTSSTPPSATTLTKVNTINSTAINATWASSPGATWYQLNMTSPNGGTMSQVSNSSALFKLVTGLTPGTQYQFTVSAGNSSGSNASIKKYNYTYNIAPTSLVFSSITKNSARVSWTNPSGNFSGFKIEYSANGGTSYVTATSNTNNSTNHYDLTSLLSNVLYTVRASTNYGTGSNYSGTSNPSTTNTFTTLPTAPTSVKANTASTSQTNLSWTAPTGNGTITGYKVEISPNNSTFSTVTSNTGNSTTVYSVTGLPSNVQDYFRISAINAGGTSIVSNVPKNTTLASTSSSLLTSSITTTSMHLSWTAPTGNATITGYKVQYSANGGISYVIANTNTGNSTTHYDFTGLSPNVLYTLQISAINAGGTGTGTTTTQVTVPAAPTILLISSVTTTGMRLLWTDTGNGTITGHKLEYSANGGTSYVTASSNTGNSTTHYDFTGLSANILYTLRVSTINAAGTSATTTTTQTTIPNAPTSLLFSGTTNSSTILSWTGTSGGNATITGYEIDKSTDGSNYSTVTPSTGNTTTTYTVTGLSSSTIYYFKVKTINSGGTSASLTPATVTTLAGTTPTTTTSSAVGGSGIGGPVTPPQIVPVVPALSQGITFTASNDIILPNEIKNETVSISWPSSETLNVNSIQFGATVLQTKLVNIPPYGLAGNQYGMSSGTILYVIQVPQQCNGSMTVNCVDLSNPSINLPISFDVTLNGTETTQTVTPQFSVHQEAQLPLSLIVIGVSFVAAGYLILRYKLRTSKLDPKRHFNTKKIKEQRLEKPKKKR